MNKKTKLSIVFLFLILICYSQKTPTNFTFHALNNTTVAQLDSVKISNLTNGDFFWLFWPDSTISLQMTGGDLFRFIGYSNGFPVALNDVLKEKNQFKLLQNNPNPIIDQSDFYLFIPKKGNTNIRLIDLQGRIVIEEDFTLEQGNHSFRLSPAICGTFFLTVGWEGKYQSIKILSKILIVRKNFTLDYLGIFDQIPQSKPSRQKYNYDVKESGIVDYPYGNKSYIFQFATNIPCPETPTVIYNGQVYNTIQIFGQCWMKENLNVGTMTPGNQGMTNNGTIEKYCYNNDTANCHAFGGLYQWDEMMQYSTQTNSCIQGICAPGWHIPSDEEWKVLEGAVDSEYRIGDIIWDNWGYRGHDAGTYLKATVGWYNGGNGIDFYDFSGLPGGDRKGDGTFYGINLFGFFSTSTSYDSTHAWSRMLLYDDYAVYRLLGIDKSYGQTVRCIRDI